MIKHYINFLIKRIREFIFENDDETKGPVKFDLEKNNNEPEIYRKGKSDFQFHGVVKDNLENKNSKKNYSRSKELNRFEFEYTCTHDLNYYPVVLIPKYNCIIKSSVKLKNNPRKKGITEQLFFEKVNKYFSVFFKVDNSCTLYVKDKRYEPDIALLSNCGKLKIDIEIDEPYTANTNEPIHFKGYDKSRNFKFTERGWVVIRFSEFQIYTNPTGCLFLLKEVVTRLDGKYSEIKLPLNQSLILEKDIRWTKEDSLKYILEKYRQGYLGMNFTEYYGEEILQIDEESKEDENIEIEEYVIEDVVKNDNDDIELDYGNQELNEPHYKYEIDLTKNDGLTILTKEKNEIHNNFVNNFKILYSTYPEYIFERFKLDIDTLNETIKRKKRLISRNLKNQNDLIFLFKEKYVSGNEFNILNAKMDLLIKNFAKVYNIDSFDALEDIIESEFTHPRLKDFFYYTNNDELVIFKLTNSNDIINRDTGKYHGYSISRDKKFNIFYDSQLNKNDIELTLIKSFLSQVFPKYTIIAKTLVINQYYETFYIVPNTDMAWALDKIIHSKNAIQ